MDALHANGVYGATASNAAIPAGYAVYDNNSNIPFGVYGTWSAAHSKSAVFSRSLGPEAAVLAGHRASTLPPPPKSPRS